MMNAMNAKTDIEKKNIENTILDFKEVLKRVEMEKYRLLPEAQSEPAKAAYRIVEMNRNKLSPVSSQHATLREDAAEAFDHIAREGGDQYQAQQSEAADAKTCEDTTARLTATEQERQLCVQKAKANVEKVYVLADRSANLAAEAVENAADQAHANRVAKEQLRVEHAKLLRDSKKVEEDTAKLMGVELALMGREKNGKAHREQLDGKD
jgi:hypothetical protein